MLRTKTLDCWQDAVVAMLSERKNKKKQWSCQPHGRRATAKRVDKIQGTDTSTDVVNYVLEQVPRSYGEAINSYRKDRWQVAMRGDFDALKQN